MKKYKRLFLLAVFALIPVLIFLLLNYPSIGLTDAEKQAALVNILGRKPNLTEAPVGNTRYNGSYASFNYPKKAKIYNYRESNIAKNKSYVELFSFDIESPRLVFNFSVKGDNPTTIDFSDISDVKLRQLPNMGFIQEDINQDLKKGLLFEKKDGTSEKTAFFIVNNRIITFSVTGNNLEDVSELFEAIINSVTFN